MTVVREGPYAGAMSEGPEYETAYALGSSCGIFDLAPIIAADRLCDMLGMDTISVGVTIAFAMECFQKGLLTLEDTGGLDLSFGNADAVLQLIHDAAYLTGFGARIARGSRALAEEIGHDSEVFAMHAKGMEVGGYDPRGAKGMALVYACGPRGGCHHAGGYTVTAELTNPDVDRFADSGKAPIALGSRNRRAGGSDSAGTCAFLSNGMSDDSLAQLIAAATGQEFGPADIYLTGERVNTLERVINVREGLRAVDDVLPRRLCDEALTDGPLAGQTVDFDLMRAEFYQASGLDPVTTLPTAETRARLGSGMGGRGSPGRRNPEAGGTVSYYRDFREYIAALEADGLVRRITTRICKDTELMPLVRLQFRGLPAEERTAFVFENVTDKMGRRFDGSVAVGVLGANRAVYAKALGCTSDRITERWAEVHKNYIPPRLVDDGPVMEEIHVGEGFSSTGGSSSSRTRSRRPGSIPPRTSPRRSG